MPRLSEVTVFYNVFDEFIQIFGSQCWYKSCSCLRNPNRIKVLVTEVTEGLKTKFANGYQEIPVEIEKWIPVPPIPATVAAQTFRTLSRESTPEPGGGSSVFNNTYRYFTQENPLPTYDQLRQGNWYVPAPEETNSTLPPWGAAYRYIPPPDYFMFEPEDATRVAPCFETEITLPASSILHETV